MEPDRSLNLGLSRVEVSERSFLSQVYFWMAMGLMITGLVAWGISLHPELVIGLMRNSFLLILLMLAQFGLVIWLTTAALTMSVTTATAGFSIYATLNGVIFSSIFLVYTHASIASTFLITAGTFAVTSFYGFVTKRDLTSIGHLAFMGLIGIIIASIVNLFLRNSAFDYVISYLGVAIFVGLTAYDTQKLKRLHGQQFESGDALSKAALLGALILYLDFVNLFLFLLRIFGRRK